MLDTRVGVRTGGGDPEDITTADGDIPF